MLTKETINIALQGHPVQLRDGTVAYIRHHETELKVQPHMVLTVITEHGGHFETWEDGCFLMHKEPSDMDVMGLLEIYEPGDRIKCGNYEYLIAEVDGYLNLINVVSGQAFCDPIDAHYLTVKDLDEMFDGDWRSNNYPWKPGMSYIQN